MKNNLLFTIFIITIFCSNSIFEQRNSDTPKVRLIISTAISTKKIPIDNLKEINVKKRAIKYIFTQNGLI